MFGKRKREINDLREKVKVLEERIEWHICEGKHEWETLFCLNEVRCKKCGRMMTEEDKARHFARRLKWVPDLCQMSPMTAVDDSTTVKSDEQ